MICIVVFPIKTYLFMTDDEITKYISSFLLSQLSDASIQTCKEYIVIWSFNRHLLLYHLYILYEFNTVV